MKCLDWTDSCKGDSCIVCFSNIENVRALEVEASLVENTIEIICESCVINLCNSSLIQLEYNHMCDKCWKDRENDWFVITPETEKHTSDYTCWECVDKIKKKVRSSK